MRQLLARLLRLRHLLPVSTSPHGPTPLQDQATHRSLHSSIPRSFRKAPSSSDRFRRKEPQPLAANGRRPIKLPKFKTYERPTPKAAPPRSPARQAIDKHGPIIFIGILNLITLHFVLSIPVPPPLPQTHDLSESQLQR
jgi:hypothetical protein